MKIDKSRVLIADIYVGEGRGKIGAVNKSESVNVLKSYMNRTSARKTYDSALILEVANGKYIDLADINGAMDYFLLSTASKLNIDNVFLLNFGYSVEYDKDRSYVQNIREVYKDNGKIELNDLIKEAVQVRAKSETLEKE